MILVIDKHKRAARNLSDALSYMGFISVGLTPPEALSERFLAARLCLSITKIIIFAP